MCCHKAYSTAEASKFDFCLAEPDAACWVGAMLSQTGHKHSQRSPEEVQGLTLLSFPEAVHGQRDRHMPTNTPVRFSAPLLAWQGDQKHALNRVFTCCTIRTSA